MSEPDYANMSIEQLLKITKQKQKERAKNIKTIYGSLRENVEALFENCKKYMHGEYSLYTIYEDSNDNKKVTYGLVYAEYFEKDCGKEEQFLATLMHDAIMLHKKLLKSGLALDYYRIMPYYNSIEGSSVLYNTSIICTNELDLNEVND